MAKQSGLGAKFLIGGYDISGDVNAIDQVNGGVNLLPGTDITQSAQARILGLRDGSMGFTTFMNPLGAHPVLSALPTADTLMQAWLPPMSVGSPVASVVAKQVGYDPARGADGALMMKVEGHGNGYGQEWGVALTPGLRTDSGPANGTSLDQGAGFATPAVPASGTPVTNTSPIAASVVISGGTVSNVAVNGVSAGSGDGTYTVPSGQAITVTYSAAPTWTWTLQTTSGAQCYLQVTAFTGTSVTVTVQEAPDGTTWSTLAAFTAVTAAPAWQRVPVTGTVARYLRAITTGTFSNAVLGVAADVNQAALEP